MSVATVYTVNGYEFGEAASAIQKCVRAGLEFEALYFALELAEAGYDNYVWKRLSIMAVEDVGIADPNVIAIVNACRETWMAYRKVEKGKARLPETNIMAHAIVTMCRAKKSRECDDLAYLMELKRKQGLKLEMSGWIIDGHTGQGKARLRALAKQNGTTFMYEWCKEFYEDVGRLVNPAATRNEFHDVNWSEEVAKFTECDPEVYAQPISRTPLTSIAQPKVWSYPFSDTEFEIEMPSEPGIKYFVDFDANNGIGACSCDLYLAGGGRWCSHMHEVRRWAKGHKPGSVVTRREKPGSEVLNSEKNLKKPGEPLPAAAMPPGAHGEE